MQAASALQYILAKRTHRKKVLGQEVIVPGQLGEALRLPLIIKRLQSRQIRQREQGVDDFSALWLTLSVTTQKRVRQVLDWYDPQDLDWDDKRSNRNPLPGNDDPSPDH